MNLAILISVLNHHGIDLNDVVLDESALKSSDTITLTLGYGWGTSVLVEGSNANSYGCGHYKIIVKERYLENRYDEKIRVLEEYMLDRYHGGKVEIIDQYNYEKKEVYNDV